MNKKLILPPKFFDDHHYVDAIKKLLEIAQKAALGEPQQACADLLIETLEAALLGHLNGLGIVAGMTGGGFGTAVTGSNAAGINLALDVLKAKVLNAVARDDALSRSSN